MSGKRLARQLKSIFGDENILERVRTHQGAIAQIKDDGARKDLLNFLENLPSLLGAVEVYYEQLDDRAALAQHSIESTTEELAENNHRLTQLNKMFETMVNSLVRAFSCLIRMDFVVSSILNRA